MQVCGFGDLYRCYPNYLPVEIIKDDSRSVQESSFAFFYFAITEQIRLPQPHFTPRRTRYVLNRHRTRSYDDSQRFVAAPASVVLFKKPVLTHIEMYMAAATVIGFRRKVTELAEYGGCHRTTLGHCSADMAQYCARSLRRK